jgi:hypothetical protein
MKSDILVGLIKEVVKNEVKQQVKEELIKLVKSGIVTVNKETPKQQTKSRPSLREMTEFVSNDTNYKSQPVSKKPMKEIVKDPMLNEILNSTTPFTAAHRVEGGPMLGATGGSILDALQPSVSMDGDWETMDYRQTELPQMQQNTPETDNPAVDALTKALTRDYTELVKRFK